MFSCNGLLSAENPSKHDFVFLTSFWLQFGYSGGIRCPSSSAMCFCEALSKPSKLCLTTPQITVRRHPMCLSNKHLGYQLAARLKVDSTHLAWLLNTREKTADDNSDLARGDVAALFAAWSLQFKSQNHNFKRRTAVGFFWWDSKVLLWEMK